MPIEENPEKYVGKEVHLNRGGNVVKVYLSSVGKGRHFMGCWVNPDGTASAGIVPFAEIEGFFIKEEKKK